LLYKGINFNLNSVKVPCGIKSGMWEVIDLEVKNCASAIMSVKIESSDNIVTAFLEGELDHHAAKGIREEIDGTLERMKPAVLNLDFRSVSFMDSSGIGLVMGRYRTMQLLGGKVVVKNASLHIRKVMRLAGLDRLAEFE
jgi:stage II sporulation protein AA (anti-sigma F factor antagonist)